MIVRFCHEILKLYYKRVTKEFSNSLSSLEIVQRKRLDQILESLAATKEWGCLRGKSYEELCHLLPVSTYTSYRDRIERQRSSKEKIISDFIVRYEPTSGSTESRKWIPYTKDFLQELNLAAAAWIGDIYNSIPEVMGGTHYWSLSWLPKELRGLTSSNDADLFPAYQRWIIKKSMALPAQIAQVSSPEAAWWATLLYLVSTKDLSLVSVWSPTFWIKITDDIKSRWPEIRSNLEAGTWGSFQPELDKIVGKAPRRSLGHLAPQEKNFFERLWPKLKLISSWDSSSSALWAEQIKTDFSYVTLQGKGLWATEGVVSIPFRGKKVLAYQSHFFEFIDLQTKEIFPAWKLLAGREYQPVIWTSAGLLRYTLQDRLRVVDFIDSTPCFEFIGRLQSVDMVGEKIDRVWVDDLFAKNPHWRAIALIACHHPQPIYYLCHQSSEQIDIERELLQFHHYKVARELGQLAKSRSVVVKDIFSLWQQTSKSRIVGQNKVESLIEVDSFKSELLP